MQLFLSLMSTSLAGCLAAWSLTTGVNDETPTAANIRTGFDKEIPGKLPSGWKVESTKQDGPLATWEVTADPSAPSAPSVLALTSSKHGSDSTFNLCWTDRVKFKDGSIELKFKAVAGEVDRGGGPIWRVKDKDNYYICRANPLESNFRVYYVKDGKRKQLASASLEIPSGTWHTIKVEHVGDHIVCSLDGKQLLDVHDSTFTEPGGVGFWTKADAVTSFDDLIVNNRD